MFVSCPNILVQTFYLYTLFIGVYRSVCIITLETYFFLFSPLPLGAECLCALLCRTLTGGNLHFFLNMQQNNVRSWIFSFPFIFFFTSNLDGSPIHPKMFNLYTQWFEMIKHVPKAIIILFDNTVTCYKNLNVACIHMLK